MDLGNHPKYPPAASFVLVYNRLGLGGIETMILRFTKKLRQLGLYACVLCKEKGELDERIAAYAEIFYLKDIKDIKTFSNATKINLQHDTTLIILSFDVGASARALYIDQQLLGNHRMRNITGVFHPQAYFMPGQPVDRMLINAITLACFGAKNTFFMNEECRRSHAKRFGLDFSESPVIPLPVFDGSAVAHAVPQRSDAKQKLRILSVGRFVPFKAYNRGAPAILRSLLDANLDVQWDIYGYGSDEEYIKRKAEELNVHDRLNLLGPLPYEFFDSSINGYSVFVGMGTAALEASTRGLPSVCALVGEENRSYGFIHELPFGNVGELIDGRSARSITDILLEYFMLPNETAHAVALAAVSYSRRYATDLFLASVLSMAEDAKPSQRSVAKELVGRVVYEVTEGGLARLVLNKGIKTAFMRKLVRQ